MFRQVSFQRRRNPTVLTRVIPRYVELEVTEGLAVKSQSHRTDQGNSEAYFYKRYTECPSLQVAIPPD
jgi:hypothetical protein